ncbi:MAT1-2-1, partial [Calycina marina]
MPSPHLFPDPSATLPRSPATSASPTSPPTAAGKAKIKRPPNAFILYRQHWHPIVVARNPNAHNNQISRIIGTMWQQSSDDEREPFRLLAVEKKAEKLRAHPDYRYQPRKSSEKRRRMTKNKVAALRA